jgi:Flp pilus assembly protein TadG
MNRNQRGQAIVMVALIMVVLFGFIGLAMDGGRGYLDRRSLQASVDAAALAAAYNYMNTNDPGQAEQAATNQYANNQRLYNPPACNGYGTANVTCSFGDPTNQVLTIAVVSHSIAGVTFTATATHQIGVTVMQVVGVGSKMSIGATATALARRSGTYGAAILTLSPGGCAGIGGTNSLTFQGNSTTTVTGDVWSNGVIFDNSNANGGSVTGNVVGICPTSPFLTTPSPWTVSGTQSNGFDIPDPNYPTPPLNPNAEVWNATSGSVEEPGTYASNPSISGQHPCFFLDAGVYDFQAGFTDNAGFMSNELRPPDEPGMASAGTANTATLNGDLSGSNITSIAISGLTGAIPSGAQITVGASPEQTFTLSAAASAGASSLSINKQSVTGTIPSGSIVAVRAYPQFWDSNNVACSGTFSATPTGSGTNSLTGTWSVELTAVRWESTTSSTCSGPVPTPTCYERESPPSMCKTVTPGPSGNIKVTVSSANSATGDPGAQSFNLYMAQNATCSSLAYVGNFLNGNNAGTTVNSASFAAGWPTGAASPPTGEGMPIASGLPNADVAAGSDLANERECVDTTSGNLTSCPSPWTPGAVAFYIPSTGCLDTHGGKADMYLFSGYQYSRVLVFEPGPEQSSQPNSCSNFINGNGFTSLIGIIYMPAAGVSINGNTTYEATIAGGVIAWTAAITGSGGVAIIADPTLRTWPSAVRLIQ